MKSFTLNELAGFLGLFQNYTGAQLQEVVSAENQLLLRWRFHRNYYLFFDLTATNPLVFWLDSEVKIKKKTTPLALFLKKYFVDALLQDVRLVNGEGRILHFYLQSKEHGDLELEARLYPHGHNLIAKAAGKIISWNKPKEVLADSSEISPVINIDEIMQTKWQEYLLKKQKLSKPQKHPQQKQIELIARLEADYQKYPVIPYKEVADRIKQQQDYAGIDPQVVDTSLPWFEAVRILIEKDKKQGLKKTHLLKRIQVLKEQLQKAPSTNEKTEDLFRRTEAKGRVKVLLDGRRAYVGKSAKDNLTLLRSAKPWYLWMHVRDYPGAHLILQQNKGQILSNEDLNDLGHFLAKESGFAKTLRSGDLFEVQYTECRYIKPIKGDKAGRVHVQKEKVIRLRFKD